MNVQVLGDNTLATVTRDYCRRHFGAVPPYDIIWVCDEVPFPEEATSIILISYPVPPGTIRFMQRKHPNILFAYSPENIRLNHADIDFNTQNRIVCGVEKPDRRLDELFKPLTPNLYYTSIETAEMVKHALNGFLAVSVAYANEIGDLCKKTGADMNHVTHCLRMDKRIGMSAYLDAGRPFGTHLEREVKYLLSIKETPLVAAAKRSNDEHKGN